MGTPSQGQKITMVGEPATSNETDFAQVSLPHLS